MVMNATQHPLLDQYCQCLFAGATALHTNVVYQEEQVTWSCMPLPHPNCSSGERNTTPVL